MLTKVRLLDERGFVLELPMDVIETNSPYAIKDVDGLGPVKALIESSSFALLDGEAYLSHRGEIRNIVMTVGFSPHYGGDESVQALRNVLYEYAMPGQVIELQFETTELEVVKIVGRVEANDPTMFSSDPENQISILCLYPTSFQSLTETVITGRTNTPFSITYAGSKPVGMQVDITIEQPTSAVTLQRQNAPIENMIYEDLENQLISGDILSLRSVRGSKHANLTRYGATNSVLGKLSPNSKWPELRPGVNDLLISTGMNSAAFTLRFTKMYGGI